MPGTQKHGEQLLVAARALVGHLADLVAPMQALVLVDPQHELRSNGAMFRISRDFWVAAALLFATNGASLALGAWLAYTADQRDSYRRGRDEGYIDGHAAGWRDGRADLSAVRP